MRISATITALFAVIAAALALQASGGLSWLDGTLLDGQFRVLRSWFPRPAAREVVVVAIDEDTIRRFPEPLALWHGHLSRFLAAMAAARPAVVGINLVLPDRSYDAVVPGSDKLLMRGLLEARRASPLVLALTVDPAGRPRAVHPPFLSLAGPGGAGNPFAYFRDADCRGAVARRRCADPRPANIACGPKRPAAYHPRHHYAALGA